MRRWGWMMRGLLLICIACCVFGRAGAKGINTFIPPDFRQVSQGSFVVTAGHPLKDGTYVESPQDRAVRAPVMHYTALGRVMNILHGLMPKDGDEPKDSKGRLLFHDPGSESAIGAFGEDYARSGPLGAGIAPHGHSPF